MAGKLTRRDDVVRLRLRKLVELGAGMMPKRFPRNFGSFEITLYLVSGALDFVRRHLAIVGEAEAARRTIGLETATVLDFGGGLGHFARFVRLYGLKENFAVTVVDVDPAALRAAVIERPLVDARLIEPTGVLPFGDGSFDMSVSSDVLEHIPQALRSHWVSELHRVTRYVEVHNIPCDGPLWSSSAADQAFQNWHLATFGEPEQWTAEHLSHGVPNSQDLENWFPGAEIHGLVNSEDWLTTMKEEALARGPLSRVLRGITYARRSKSEIPKPPFKSAFITYWLRHASEQA